MEKKWGLYPGRLKPEEVEKLDEIDVWKKIDNLGGTIFWALHDIDKPWNKDLSVNQIIEAQYSLEYLIYHTRKYGVEFSKEPSCEEHIERSSSYLSWYSFWKRHFDSMSEEEYRAFVDDKFVGKDISKYMPINGWQYQKTKKR